MAELARNLTHADQYRTIATALRRADRTPEAIAWARRGLAEKGSWLTAERLRDLLVDLLIDVGDGSAALAERRAEFERRPTHAAYRDLIDSAARVGAERQQEWAMGVLTDRTVRDPRHARELVAVLLGEGLLEQAWQIGYSHPDQLPEPQWVHLLDQRRVGHPADVIEPYRELVEAHVTARRPRRRWRFRRLRGVPSRSASTP